MGWCRDSFTRQEGMKLTFMPPKIFGGQHPRYQHHEIFKTKVMNGWRVKYRCRSLLTVQILLIGDTPAIAMSEFGLSDRQPGCTRIRCVGIVQLAMTCSTLPPLTPEVVANGWKLQPGRDCCPKEKSGSRTAESNS